MNQLLPLARRYRPHNFQSMVGQQTTLRALINALDAQRLHQAYLFTGTRGVGKTTLARILAKCLNCEQGITSLPCEQCSACVAIQQGRFVDLMEIDAASKTKVEDTRELLDNVQYLPTCGRFKIYLIDEVHMLSGHSFNALLKTLEEPPPHVKFLLATTDPQKLPITILSRCLQFHLRPIAVEQIISHLESVLVQEKIQYELAALKIISRLAEGSLRDALSLLDQAIVYAQGEIKTDSVREMLGLTKPKELRNLLKFILQGNAQDAFQIVSSAKEKNVDFNIFLVDLVTLLHQMAIAKETPIALSDSIIEKESILKLADEFSHDTIQLYYQIALIAQRDIAYAPSPQIGVEMMILRMIAFRPFEIYRNEPNLSVSTVVSLPSLGAVDNTNTVPSSPKVEQETEWNLLIQKLSLTGVVKMMAEHCTVAAWDSAAIQLILAESQKPLLNKRNEERLNAALNEHFKKTIRLSIQLGHQVSETPAKQNQRVAEEKLVTAKKLVESDPRIKKLVQVFDGKIEEVSMIQSENIS